ncbi:hypothetical protein GGR55DRAFT_648842 [Xylaria sp. FL0064]|nr:hypothetical protein GGR55DRAFT_648842 [Xylaria sp. FL0064]
MFFWFPSVITLSCVSVSVNVTSLGRAILGSEGYANPALGFDSGCMSGTSANGNGCYGAENWRFKMLSASPEDAECLVTVLGSLTLICSPSDDHDKPIQVIQY